MDDASTKVFVVTATISGALVMVGSLIITGKRPWSAWIMAAGAALGTLGMAMTSLVAFELSEWLERHGEYPCCGSMCLGAMVFAIGFLLDQIRHRAVVRHRRQLEEMAALAASPPHGKVGPR